MLTRDCDLRVLQHLTSWMILVAMLNQYLIDSQIIKFEVGAIAS